jgi:hypothetical protein
MVVNAEREPEQVPVAVALNRVQRDIGAISKDRRATGGQTFAFRGIEDVMNALHPILVEHGVLIVPDADDAVWEFHERVSSAGNKSVNTQVRQRVAYKLVGPMGDHIEAASMGEGSDFSDKATNKSTSSALKYLLTTLFSIPTQDMEDSDRDSTPTQVGREEVTPENDRHFERREGLRSTIAGLPDDVQQRVVTWMREHEVSLRYACTKAVLDRVERQITAASSVIDEPSDVVKHDSVTSDV